MITQQTKTNPIAEALIERHVPCAGKGILRMCKPCRRMSEQLLGPLDHSAFKALLEDRPECRAERKPSPLSRVRRWLSGG